jgi:anaerobic ribonucleoside-triphosphate reductase activating protein
MLRILDITAPDINNGIGIRVTLWVAGCNHHCPGCHNAWSWDFNQGKPLKGNEDEIDDRLSNWLERDYVDGITISGGDPLCQEAEGLWELTTLLYWIRKNFPEKTIWIYTGYVYEDLLKEIENNPNNERSKALRVIFNNTDVLVDGPYKQELRDTSHTPFRGSTNQRLITLGNRTPV